MGVIPLVVFIGGGITWGAGRPGKVYAKGKCEESVRSGVEAGRRVYFTSDAMQSSKTVKKLVIKNFKGESGLGRRDGGGY